MPIRESKKIINKDDIEFLLTIKEPDITFTLFMELFGEFDGKCRFHPYDHFTVPEGVYGPENNKNTKPFTTTVGLWIWNRYLIETELFDIFKYISHTLDKKKLGAMHTRLSYALLEDEIDVMVLRNFLKKTQHIMPFVSILSPSTTEKMLTSSTVISKKKDELIKSKYGEAIANGDGIAAAALEKELQDYAKEYLKDDPSMDSYDSGARGSFGNNFKNMFIMKGAIKDPDPDKGMNIAVSNYMDGVSKEEYAIFANSLAEGPYARGQKTAIGGYWEKLFVSAFQHVVLEKEGSDCKTKRYVEVTLSPSNIGDWMYSYIIEGSNLVELNSKNSSKYMGKTVKFRYSSLCESKKGYCSKCIGTLPYKQNIENIGTFLGAVPSRLKNISMKSFHANQIVYSEMDINKVFSIK